MTGYARADGAEGLLGWTWEAKSVNGRGLEIRCRLPSGYDGLEIPAREAATRRFKRGSLNLAFSLRRQGAAASIVVNEARLNQLAEIVQAAHRRFPGLRPASIDGLLGIRGVLEFSELEDETILTPEAAKPLLATLEQALDGLAVARAAEGGRLAEALASRLDEIGGLIGRAATAAVVNVAVRKERLREQVKSLIEAAPALPEERLLAEAALLASKGDVAEEIERLRSHVTAARDMLAGTEAMGRRLDFLCQEFNREANTLCSKASELTLTAIGLELKASIEQFREQVQNAE